MELTILTPEDLQNLKQEIINEISIVVLFSSFMRSTTTELKKDLFHQCSTKNTKNPREALIYSHLRGFSVAADVLLSNQFMEDLDRIWALRPWIPDPKDPSTWK